MKAPFIAATVIIQNVKELFSLCGPAERRSQTKSYIARPVLTNAAPERLASGQKIAASYRPSNYRLPLNMIPFQAATHPATIG
jgi:hypothetical protein